MAYEVSQRVLIPQTVNNRAPAQGVIFDGNEGATFGLSGAGFGQNDFTFSAIINSFSITPSVTTWIFGGGTGCLSIGINTTSIRFKKVGASETSASFNFLANESYHIIVTRSTLIRKTYVNGILIDTAVDGINYDGANTCLNGHSSSTDQSTACTIRSPLIYNRGLSETEAQSLYEEGVPRKGDYNNARINSAVVSTTFLMDFSGGGTISSASATGFNLSFSSGNAPYVYSDGTLTNGNGIGKKFRVQFTLTRNSGTTVDVVMAEASTAAGLTTKASALNPGYGTATSYIYEFESTYAYTTPRFYFTTTGGAAANFTISNYAVYQLGLIISPEQNQLGGGLIWSNTSANDIIGISLPSTGTSWCIPFLGRIAAPANLNLLAGNNYNINFIPSGTGDVEVWQTSLSAPTSYRGLTVKDTVGFRTLNLGLASTYSWIQSSSALVLNLTNNVLVGGVTDNGFKFEVTGTSRFNGDSTFNGKINSLASTTSFAGLNIPHGSAPSSPVNGDMWTTTTGLYIRINNTTVGPLGSGGNLITSVSGTANQVTVSPTTGNVVVSLPTSIVGVNSLTAQSGNDFTITAGSSGATISAKQGANGSIWLTPQGSGYINSYGTFYANIGYTRINKPFLDGFAIWDRPIISVTGASGDGTFATLTFATQTFTYPVGSTIVVSGMNPSGYNGTYIVQGSTTSSVSYASSQAGFVSGGTVEQLFVGIKSNVSDSASNANSLLIDLQVGEVSKFKVTKSGDLTATSLAGSGSSITGLTKSQVGLSNVTNDVQTKAAIVPNTVPSAGQILVGNAGGTAYAPVSMSGNVTISSTGATTIGSGVVTNTMLASFGLANGVATLDANGKLTSTQIPDISVVQYLGVVATEAAMLALTGQQGDWCTRSDLGTNWIITGNNPTQIGSWTQLSYPTSPVTSVFGRTGAVAAVSTDYSVVGITNTAIGLTNPSSGNFVTLTSSGASGTSGALFLKSFNTTSGAVQHWADFQTSAGVTLVRFLRGNGASGYDADGLNVESWQGFNISLNSLGGANGKFVVKGGDASFETGGALRELNVTNGFGSARVAASGSAGFFGGQASMGTIIQSGGVNSIIINATNTTLYTVSTLNVGIGASPSYKLDVSGDTRISGNVLAHKVANYTTSYPGISSFGAAATNSSITYYDTGKTLPNANFRGVVWTGKHYVFTDYSAARAYFYDNNFDAVNNAYGVTYIGLPIPSGYGSPHGAAWDGRYLWVMVQSASNVKIVGYDVDTSTNATIIAESAAIAVTGGSAYDVEYADGHLYFSNSGTMYIYKWNGSAIDLVATKASSVGSQTSQGITYDGSYLWAVQNGSNIYKVKLDGTQVSVITSGFPSNITGWAWNGSNIVAFEYNTQKIYVINTAQYRIDTQNLTVMGGKVGIGTVTPSVALHIKSDGAANTHRGVLRIENTGSSKWGGISFPDNAAGSDSNSNNFYLIGRGNVINDRTLTVHIPTAADYGDSTEPRFGIYSTGSNLLFFTEANTGNTFLKGKVGIGNPYPFTQFEVQGQTFSSGEGSRLASLYTTDTFGAGVGPGMSFGGMTGALTGYYYFANIQGFKENAIDGNQAGGFRIITNPNGGPLTERLRITSTGNVGIGESVPNSILHIKGTTTTAITITDDTNYHFYLENNNGVISYTTDTGNAAATSASHVFKRYNLDLFKIDQNGKIIFTPQNYSAGSWTTTGALTSFGSATVTNNNTAASGTAASAVFHSFAQPTLAATNLSVTTTEAATVYIAGGPITGTNQTITNSYPLWVAAGRTKLKNLTAEADFSTYTGDGLYNANANPVIIRLPNNSSVRIGYTSIGDGQYYGRMAALAPNGADWKLDWGANGNNFTVAFAASEKFRIRSDGNVGIGTITPGQLLDVVGTSSTNAFIRVIGGSGSTVGGLIIGNNDVTKEYGKVTWDNASNTMYVQHTYNSGSLILGANSSNHVTILANGNVGIGVTNPSSILDAVVVSGATSGLRFKGYSDATTPYLLSLGTFNYADQFQVRSVNGLVTMGIVGAVGANPDLAFMTNTIERMRILSNGNIGIWNTNPTEALEIGTNVVGKNIKINSTLGSELIPSLTAGNWSGTNWSATGTTITHTTGSNGSISPVSALSIVAGKVYKVVMTLSAGGGSYTYFSLGGKSYSITGDATQIWYVYAINTNNLVIGNLSNGDPTTTITSISIKETVGTTGKLNVEGPVTFNSTLSINNLGIGTPSNWVINAPLEVIDYGGNALRLTRKGVASQYLALHTGDGSTFTIAAIAAGNDKAFNISTDATVQGINFLTASTKRAEVRGDGNFHILNSLGVGTATPSAKLDVQDSLSGTSLFGQIGHATGGKTRFWADSAGQNFISNYWVKYDNTDLRWEWVTTTTVGGVKLDFPNSGTFAVNVKASAPVTVDTPVNFATPFTISELTTTVSNTLSASNSTDITVGTYTTGALQVTGGVSISKALQVNTNITAANYLVTTASSTEASGLAVQRVFRKTVAAGELYKLAEFNDTEGDVAIEIQVSSETGAHSGTSTYIFQGGYNQLTGSYYRLYPSFEGRGHGDGADSGLNNNAWNVFIYGSTIVGGYTYGVAIHVPSGRSNKILVVTITELKRGMTFTDQSATAAITSFTNSGNIYSHRNVLIENSISAGGNITVSGTTNTIGGTTIPASSTLVTTANNLSVFSATTSAQLAGIISDETGSGALVFANTPTLVTPNIGAATGTSISLTGSATAGTATTGYLPIQLSLINSGSVTTGAIRFSSQPDGAGGYITFNGTVTANSSGTIVSGSSTITSDHSNRKTGLFQFVGGTTDSAGFQFFTSNAGTNQILTERLRIQHDGNVGIGQVSPSYKLHVKDSSSSVIAVFETGSNDNIQLRFKGTSGERYAIGNKIADGGSGLAFDIYDLVNSINRLRIDSNGNVGIGTAASAITYKLEVNGSFAATTKSFVIDHPTKVGKKLRYGSLEGPENGVYIRGETKSKVIELPEYWTKLVDPKSITVQLTPIGSNQKLYVEKIENNKVYIANANLLTNNINCFFYILAERVDVEKLQTEINA